LRHGRAGNQNQHKGENDGKNPFHFPVHLSLPVDMPHCSATFSVAAIMPEALRSGKAPQSRADTRFSAKRNEWIVRP
jgi:hypothetical protein